MNDKNTAPDQDKNTAPDQDTKPVLTKKERKAAAIAARTPEMIKVLKAKKDKRKDAKLVARQTLIDFIKSYADEPVKLAAAKLWPSAMSGVARAPREASTRVTAGELLLSLFGGSDAAIGSTVSEADVFAKIDGYGRMEMRKAMVRAVKNAKTPEERVWVSFNFTDKLYTLRADPWSGYRPLDIPAE
jgi:hypothetical protein